MNRAMQSKRRHARAVSSAPRGLPVTDLVDLERRLWAAADALRANSSLTPAEYRGPVRPSRFFETGSRSDKHAG